MSEFFEDLANTKPYLKVALEGFAGTGKSYTATHVALGLHRYIGSTKPIALFDTEEAAKFSLPFLEAAGVQAKVKRSRSLADLSQAMKLCADGFADILLIDSISHVWEDFLGAYRRKRKTDRLEFQDWGIIKPQWKETFSDPFVRLPVHILMTGRAGYEYETELDDRGKRQIYKSGIKMKVEGETAYEPDILVLMERFEELLEKQKRVWREATILKDRSTLLDGKTFKNPTFEDFQPAVERILHNAAYKAAASETDAGALIDAPSSWPVEKREREIACEEIQAALVKAYPGQSAAEKKAKADIISETFSTGSWTKVQTLSSSELRAGLNKIREKLGQAPPAHDYGDLPDNFGRVPGSEG